MTATPADRSVRARTCAPAATWLALLLLAAPAARAQLDCSDCHEVELAPASVHAAFECADCHSDVADYPHPEDMLLGEAVCAQCHDAGDDLAESVHGGVLSCLECHGEPHEILPLDDLDSNMSPIKQVATCGDCHETDEGLIDGYLVSVHGRALLRSGLVTAAPSCSDCHGAHDILPVAEEASRVSHAHVPETCGQCHSAIFQEWQDSTHGEIWRAGSDAGPVCMTCHSSHRVERPYQRETRLKTPETCGNCHEESLLSYRDSFHGQVTDLGFVTGAICSDCHTPHSNLPASDPASTIHPDHLAATCGQCHGEVSAAFLSFDPHAEPQHRAKNPGLYWIWLFMTALLIGVFSFFGVHTVLWLQRALVALSRGELAHERSLEGPWVRRFSPGQRRIHAVVIVTFLTLAATGLPLKFHYVEWAQALVSWPGGVSLSRFLHRVAAVLTFGYFLVHLGMILKRTLVRREPGMLWGWKSMIPRGKDLADLWNNLRYFLYLGPRPKFDRFTYWEKFDYFAVFWGVAIIGLSGLVLWFPETAAVLLPGWMLNAAYVIHSDEALLAVGFIFVFHFFHTHLRPEAFPMDPVIFLGAIPLERFQAERPLEYRRLVERGELEARIVPTPSPERLRTARIWGLTAVAVGLLLVVGILWGFISH
jgi:thiosulfate reductase cytochrome b subunit